MTEHLTVLLKEAVTALVIDKDGLYIDGTFGRGGHSRAILAELNDSGRLIGIDKDPQAVQVGNKLADEEERFTMKAGSFAEQIAGMREQGVKASGLLLDLGVSSPQLDQAERGFSFMKDGALDMRMDPESGQSAAEWLAVASEKEIAAVLKEFGEERFAKRIAAAIVAARQQQAITTTKQLANIVSEANPAWEKDKHPATRSFQAIRIFINNELGDLEKLLADVLELLLVGGRLVIISFHSLEDRMVKRFIRKHVKGDELPREIPIMQSALNRRLQQVGKAVRASSDEVALNPRARSAIMRVAEKIA